MNLFTDEFVNDNNRQTQWKLFLKKILWKESLDFGTVMQVIDERLKPMADKYWKSQKQQMAVGGNICRFSFQNRLSLCPIATIEFAIVDSFGQMFGCHTIASGEIGYRAGHFQNTAVGSGRERKAFHGHA